MMLALLTLSIPSLAAYATVDAIWEPNAAGTRWDLVSTSNGARVERDGKQTPLRLDAPLNATDRIVTTRGRVRIRLDDDDTITVYENSSVVLKEWGVIQELGAALYWVQGLFTVKFSSGEAAVEGTRFAVVLGDEKDKVEVYRGTVTVSGAAGGELAVSRGASAAIEAGTVHIPTPNLPGEPNSATGAGRRGHRGTKLDRDLYDRPKRYSQPMRPRVELGARVGVGSGDEAGQTQAGLQVQLDAVGRLRMPGPLDPTLTLGVVNSAEATFFPLTLGMEHTLGPLYAGLGGGFGFGAAAVDTDGDGVCDDTRPVARPELTVSIGGRLQPGRRWVIQPALTGVWLDGPAVRGTVGVSYAF